MSKLEALRAAKSLSDLAYILEEKPSVLSYVIYKIPSHLKYKEFEISKKTGGKRVISAPIDRLKRIQRNLADLLLGVQGEISKDSAVDNNCVVSHAFKRNLSIITNARNHRNKRYVFNADLKDFFPSINFGRVYGFFIKNQHFCLHPKVATVIAQIACHNNSLPQGSPCSPIISDFIGHILDMRLSRMAGRHRCTYTRYADDLSFSTNERVFPKAIAYPGTKSPNSWVPGDELLKNIFKSGFKLNNSKTRLQYKSSRQEATGLIVNKSVSVPTEYYHTTRAMCHNLFNLGFGYSNLNGSLEPVSDSVIRGRLNYIHHVRSMQNKLENGPSMRTTAPFKLYQSFLNFVSFFGITKPVIIGEGVTDTIYLKAALNQLAAGYPNLIQVSGQEKEHQLKFFRYSNSSRELMGLSGGTGELKNLLGDYRKRISGFKSGGRHPVIILVDNDEGSKAFFSTLGSITKTKVTGLDPFYYVYSNLYAVPIPPTGNPVTAIEGLFDPALLGFVYEGKKLDLTNKESDGSKFYSKHTFAKDVVRPNQSKINFNGFNALLTAIDQVLLDYNAKLVSGIAP
ncbi:retron Ec67 family RNA-directed DNA polymerase/endonuclease [Agrobacterium sp. CNPSo 3708]|uniref:retron Ec67 family RNA-directed DNA polymerase/endonuclease n=1 Tax=unclassified Agrobacterium TaxID=2632611 RepID=UPI002363AA27|nr:retron Ec67 family RNA-directed DNA polymerase/endonuclease [Agrobacterium sp. CNPSo 3708]MDD1499859.1 retron Ec67 family RNA-directed DNA polymerase/endonuclease [Agrobacterium sp. CNPSo 3708]